MEIEFSTNEDYFNLKENFPTPIKFNMPEWFKKLKHGEKDNEYVFTKTVKGCMPFLETLTNGYLLRTPVDYHIRHGSDKNEKGEPILKVTTSLDLAGEKHNEEKNLNINSSGTHPPIQLKGAPEVEKNGNLPFTKISNPWIIKTPPGYSCLFLNPMNNKQQDFFSIIPGIVHTDKYDSEINFPITVNYEKYGHTELTIARGTPYVQIIPFKRDDWKMITKAKNKKRHIWNLSFLNNYKNRIFNKGKTKWV